MPENVGVNRQLNRQQKGAAMIVVAIVQVTVHLEALGI
jgi:hypothetical protein